MNKSHSNDTLEEVYLSNSSLLSDSTNFSDDALNDKNIRVEEPTTTKRKSRLVTAFRSFRKKKIETKSSEEYPEKSGSPEPQRKTSKSDKKGSRASRLVKRLSMSGIRRPKKSTDNLKRETPEGATLSVSEISLLEIEADETTATSIVKTTAKTNKAPRKGDQLQITISGKKIEKRRDAIVNPISDTKITEAEPAKPQRKPKKFDITVSDQDASPNVQAPPIPYSLCGSDISVSSISTVEKISHTHSIEQSSISTGVIKKSSFRKQNKRPLPMSTSKTGSLERGRRFPRPADEAKTDVPSGSPTVDNPTGSKPSTDPPTKIGPQPKPPTSQPVSPIEDKPKIAFEVGTKVRPLSTPSNLNRIETIVNYSGRDEFGVSDANNKCSEESSSESKSDTANRRRIAYVAAPAISITEDEPADSFLSMEPLSHLSGISEYNSLDSDFSLPPLFVDVIDDDNGVGGILNEFVFS